jgi:glucokinase
VGGVTERVMVGVDVGGTSMKGGVVDRGGRIVGGIRRQPTRPRGDEPSEEVVESILAFAEGLVAAGRERHGHAGVVGVGLVIPGIIDEDRGVALAAINVEWRGDPIVDRLSRRVGLPAVLGHDARSAGLAEGLWGSARGSRDYLFIAVGTGVGAAVVLGGEPYFRSFGAGGEFGHMTVNGHGPDCVCGRTGCVEAYAGGRSISRRYMARVNATRTITGKEVMERMRQGDRLARQVWDDAVWALGTAIVNSVVLLSPDVVVIGGGVAEAGRVLFDPLSREVSEQIPGFHQRPAPPIVRARFRKRAGIVGAAARAWLACGVSREELEAAPR